MRNGRYWGAWSINIWCGGGIKPSGFARNFILGHSCAWLIHAAGWVWKVWWFHRHLVNTCKSAGASLVDHKDKKFISLNATSNSLKEQVTWYIQNCTSKSSLGFWSWSSNGLGSHLILCSSAIEVMTLTFVCPSGALADSFSTSYVTIQVYSKNKTSNHNHERLTLTAKWLKSTKQLIYLFVTDWKKQCSSNMETHQAANSTIWPNFKCWSNEFLPIFC